MPLSCSTTSGCSADVAGTVVATPPRVRRGATRPRWRPRHGWSIPGRRQVLVVAVLIAVAGASLLLLPGTDRSYRAVASSTPGDGAPPCLEAAAEEARTDDVVAAVARRARVGRREVAGRTEVLRASPGALRVSFQGDSAYLAQQGAHATVVASLRAACTDVATDRLVDLADAEERLRAAEAALRAPPPPGGAPAPPAALVAARDDALEDLAAAETAFARQDALPDERTEVAAAEALASRAGALERLIPVGAALVCILVALGVLRTGWRRAAAGVPA